MANTTVYTAPEVAAILGLHVNSVYRLAARGALPCFYAGAGRGTWRMTDAQLRDYIAERTEQAGRDTARLFGPKSRGTAETV